MSGGGKTPAKKTNKMKTAFLIYTTPIYGGVERVKLTKKGKKDYLLRAFLKYQTSLLPSDAEVIVSEIK